MTPAEARNLPVTTDVVTAGRALGISRSVAYELAKRDELGVPILRVGSRLRVRRADLLELLGIADTEEAAPHQAASPTSVPTPANIDRTHDATARRS